MVHFENSSNIRFYIILSLAIVDHDLHLTVGRRADGKHNVQPFGPNMVRFAYYYSSAQKKFVSDL